MCRVLIRVDVALPLCPRAFLSPRLSFLARRRVSARLPVVFRRLVVSRCPRDVRMSRYVRRQGLCMPLVVGAFSCFFLFGEGRRTYVLACRATAVSLVMRSKQANKDRSGLAESWGAWGGLPKNKPDETRERWKET